MAFSDIEEEKDRKRTTNRAVTADTNKRWSDQQKLEAVQTYLVLGNVSMVSRITGIPRITIQVWKASNWWKELVEELKVQEKIELSNKLKKIVEAAHAVVEDRLVNGDPVMDPRTGELKRKPVAMKDAHRVAVDLFNQREVVDKATSPAGEKQEGNVDQLEKLAEKFAEFATKKIEQKLDNKRTVDVPFVEIVDEAQMVPRRADAVEVLPGEPGGVSGVDEGTQEAAQKVAD